MLKRILILTGAVVLSLSLVSGLLVLASSAVVAVRASPALQAGCIPVTTDITTTQTWTGACYHVMTSTVAIQAGAILTISPSVASTGTLILFDPGARLYVYGSLQALGVPGRSITFTSVASQARCAWQGIGIDISSPDGTNRIQDSTIEYACIGISIGGARYIQILSNTIRYNGDGGSKDGGIGGITDWANIASNSIYSNSNGIVLNKSFYNTIYSNTVHDINFYGILFVQEAATPGGGGNWITHNDIHDVISGGVRLEAGTSNQVLSNSIYLNRSGAVYLSGQTSTYVQYNHVFSNGGGSGYPAAVYVTGTGDLAVNEISYNVIHDRGQDAIEHTAGNTNPFTVMRYNALCSVSAYELRNDAGTAIDGRYSWWGTNTPTLGSEYIGPVSITPWITLSLITSTADLPADGVFTSVITIALREPSSGATVPPASTRQTDPPAPNARRVELATTMGAISPTVVYVGENGFATAILTSPPTTGTARISATAFCNYPISIPVRFAATNLAITKTSAITQVAAGDVITYRITYSNTSGIAANDVRITDTLPPGSMWLSDTAASLGWARIQTSPQVIYTRLSLLPGVRESFVLTATVPRSCNPIPPNRVAIGTRTLEEIYTDNSASAGPVGVICADVTLTKTTALTRSVPGDLITYTIVYSNVGSATAYGVTITDVLPVGTRYWANTSGLPCPACTVGSTGPLVWSVSSPMPPSSSYSFNLTLQVDRNSTLCGTSLTNSVSIATLTPESNLSNNSAQARPLPLVCADVTLTKTTALTRSVPGDLITYTIVYSNVGSATAYGVTITDVLPTGTRYWTDTSGLPCPACTVGSTGLLTWSVSSPMPPSASFSFSLTLQVDRNSALCGTSLTNSVSIATLTPESNLSNNISQAGPLPLVCADVFITKTTVITQAVAGGLIDYTITYGNLGAAPAKNATITDTLPAGTRYVTSSLPCPACVPGATGPLTRSVGTLPPGSSYTFSLTLRVDSGTTNCNLVVPPNTVVIATTTPETNTANNIAASSSVSSICPVDLVVTKDDDVGLTVMRGLAPGKQVAVDKLLRAAQRLEPQAVTQHRDFVYEGDLITYTISVVNVGTITATNVVLTETLPQYTSFVTGFCRIAAATFTAITPITYILPLGSLPPGGAGDICYFVVRVDDPITGDVSSLINRVCGFGVESDANSFDNCGYEDTPVRRQPLHISKWTQCVVPNKVFTYWLTYTNMTSATYYNVPITDTLPISATYTGDIDDWICPGNLYCAWTAPVIYSSTTNIKPLSVRLDRNYPYAVVTNTVVISDSKPFTLVTPVDRNPDLYVVKNDCIGPQSLEQRRAWEQIRHLLPTNAQSGCEPPYREFARPGERITYTIAYGNNGIVTATNVILTETLPNNTTYVGGGWVPAGGRSYTISLGTLGPQQGGEVEFIVQVNDPFPCGSNRVVNRVDIGGGQSECDLTNNWSADHTPISGCTSIQIYLPIIIKQEPVIPVEVAFSRSNYYVWETMGVATITVVLHPPSTQTVTVNYATSDGTATAGLDYITSTGTLTFAPGATSATFTVQVLADTITETLETVNLTLSNPVNATIGQPHPATLTIVDPCPPTPPDCAPAVWCVFPSEFRPMGMAYDSAAGRLFVANQGVPSGSGNLSIFQNSGLPLGTVDGLISPQAVALDSTRGRNRAYVVGANWLHIVELSATTPYVMVTLEVGVGEDVGAYSVAYNPNTDLIYVTGYRDDSLTVINAETWHILRRMTGFDEPSYTVVNTATNKVYISNHRGGVPSGYVSVISGTAKFAPDIYLSGDLYGIAVDSIRNRIYVASISAARVYLIDGRTDSTMGDIQIIRARDSRPVPLRMTAVNPSVIGDTHLWLTSISVSEPEDFWGMNRLILLHLPGSSWPPQPPMVLRAVPVEASPQDGLVFDPNPASWRVFASSTVSDLVTVSQDNATLCSTRLYMRNGVEQDSYYPVVHDYTYHKPGR